MVLDETSIINLGDSDPNIHGVIDVDGRLTVQDQAEIINADIYLNQARFTGDAMVINCDIHIDALAPPGSVFADANAIIEDNDIYVNGDRYMALNPSIFAGSFSNNRIFVTITEGAGKTRGGLFEMRGKPGQMDTSSCDPNYFICSVDPNAIPACSLDTWTIERLTLVEGAKLDMTNRFPFQPPYDSGGEDEVLYVKELIMEPNSILNTAYNNLYYGDLDMDPAAAIEDVPLLGFSLINITFDDEVEYVVRIRHNNDQYPSDMHVKRVVGQAPDPAGMMKMTNFQDPNVPAYRARAKGVFSNSSEAEVLILFEYLFDYDPNLIDRSDVELAIYLSEDPELNGNRVQVGRLKAPPQGRPGSVGSGRFGTFHAYVDTQGLEFWQGTNMELELFGPGGTSVYINNFDPQVWCRDLKCGDVTGDLWVTVLDYLTVVGEYGTTAEVPSDGSDSRACLDSLFSRDGYVDLQDVASWDWLLNQPDTPHLCAVPMTSATAASGSVPMAMSMSGNFPLKSGSAGLTEFPGELLIAGKRPSVNNPSQMEDSLYVFDQTGQYQASGRCVLEHANTRLIQDGQGQFYQANLQAGIVPIADANSILGSSRLSTASDPRYGTSSDVLIGLQGDMGDWSGRPIQDAAFDTAGYLYVVPVIVDPNASGEPYMAAAKLQLAQDPNIPPTLITLYDDPPQAGDNQERNALRELEVDPDGYLYVLNAHSINESSILWVYHTDSPVHIFRIELGDPNGTSYIPGPVAMHASRQTENLYLASSLNAPDAGSMTLYQMSTNDFSVSPIPIPEIGHVTDITEDPATGDIWVSGFQMSNIPEYPNVGDSPFYEPRVAHLSSGGEFLEVLDLSLGNDPNNDLALPISIHWAGPEPDPCEGADIDDSGTVGLGDVARMGQAWLSSEAEGNWDEACDLAIPADNRIDLLDFAVIGRNWFETGCPGGSIF